MALHRALWVCAGAFFAMLPQAAPAQEVLKVPSPVLTIDREALFSGSHVADRVTQEMERRTSELTAENREIEAQLTAEELDLTEKRPTLSPDEFRSLADAFDEKVQRLRAEQDGKAQELQAAGEQARQDFLRRITPLLAEILREKGAVALFDRRSVFLSADGIDITADAIARINAALDDGSTVSPTDLPLGVPVPDEPSETQPPGPVPDQDATSGGGQP